MHLVEELRKPISKVNIRNILLLLASVADRAELEFQHIRIKGTGRYPGSKQFLRFWIRKIEKDILQGVQNLENQLPGQSSSVESQYSTSISANWRQSSHFDRGGWTGPIPFPFCQPQLLLEESSMMIYLEHIQFPIQSKVISNVICCAEGYVQVFLEFCRS